MSNCEKCGIYCSGDYCSVHHPAQMKLFRTYNKEVKEEIFNEETSKLGGREK